MAATMTRRHFEAIAATLRDIRPKDWSARAANSGRRPDLEVWEHAVRRMAATLATFNGAFRASQFYTACGLEN